MIVDSHTHASLAWYEPIETLLYEMDGNGVDRAVLIQIMGETDNSYQTTCVRGHPDRFSSVVVVDPRPEDALAALERLAEAGASGVRLTPRTRSPGADPLAIWRAAARLGLPVSCGGSSADFASDEFARLVEALPETTIVLEHLAGISRPETSAASAELRRKAFELARFPNVSIKVPGLGEFCTRALPVRSPFPFEEPIPPYLDLAYDHFGPGRMMWGSDFPPVAGREGYGRALRLPMEQLAGRSAADRELIFGGVAHTVFRPR